VLLKRILLYGEFNSRIEGVCFERPARHVSARGKIACPRATCERRARSSGARRSLFGVLGLAYMVFAPAPSPPLVESTAHFENDTFVKVPCIQHPSKKSKYFT